MTLGNGSALHMLEYLGGVRLRAGRIKTVALGTRRVDPVSVFAHALVGGTTRSVGTISETGFMMGYGGGVDVIPRAAGAAYPFGVRGQFDWLPSRTNQAWTNRQFRISFGVVWSVRYWD